MNLILYSCKFNTNKYPFCLIMKLSPIPPLFIQRRTKDMRCPAYPFFFYKNFRDKLDFAPFVYDILVTDNSGAFFISFVHERGVSRPNHEYLSLLLSVKEVVTAKFRVLIIVFVRESDCHGQIVSVNRSFCP